MFVALWPPARLAAALHGLCAAGPVAGAGTLVAPGRIHLTLHFLGDVPLKQLPALCAALQLPWQPFELRVTRIVGWQHSMVVAEPEAVPPALIDLHAALGDALRRLGLRTESRPFRPHLTLLRRQRSPVHAHVLPARAALLWTVRTYALVRSGGSADGGYRLLRSYRCRAAPSGP